MTDQQPEETETQQGAIVRSEGVTRSERHLKRLCERSFLSLWSHAGIYRDQGRTERQREGKEVCDLLVVFGNHVVIFSDKDCGFPDTGNLELDWSRWYRRAIDRSAQQLFGAERWIRKHPSRLFLDRGCRVPFPVPVPDEHSAVYHLVLVANGASARCRAELGGRGSLMLFPRASALDDADDGSSLTPFAVGSVDPSKGFVHVFDEVSLDLVMSAIDTASDFVAYLTKKRRFAESGHLLSAAGEEELVAYYLKNLNSAGEHDFVVPKRTSGIVLDEGIWDQFCRRPERRAQLVANRVSYLWDKTIEKFNTNLLAGSLHTLPTTRGITDVEIGLRFLAREGRTRRRMLSDSLMELYQKSLSEFRVARVLKPSGPGDPYYVFLFLRKPAQMTEEDYRLARQNLLHAYLLGVRLRFADALDVVGLATDGGLVDGRSEDLGYLDTRDWNDEMAEEAKRAQNELGVLRELRFSHNIEQEYPDVLPGGRISTSRTPPSFPRNSKCPCGSGSKFKKCCGKAA